MRHLFAAATALPMLLFTASAAGAQSVNDWGFESGNLNGWTATGDAFVNQPTFGNNVVLRRPGESPGQDGHYWIGTYENFPNSQATFGAVQGDGPQGTLTSNPFIIEGQSISFLVGGGRDANTEFVGLLIKSRPGRPPPPPNRPDLTFRMADGMYQLMERATGRDDERMMRTIWDVSRHRGETARIIIVDRASGHWGHINADSFQLSWRPYLTASNTGPARALPPGSSSTPPAQVHAIGGGPVVVNPPDTLVTVRRRVRLTLTSFDVISQTYDNPLETDGRGDEVYFQFDVATVGNGEVSPIKTLRTAIFGERGGVVAGTARNVFAASEEQGGLVTGNHYPPDNNHRPINEGDLPFVVFDKVLDGTEDATIIVPSAWEWDSSDESRSQRSWSQFFLPHALQSSTADIERRTAGAALLRINQYWNSIVADQGGTRPIGAMVDDYTPGGFLGGRSQPHRFLVTPLLLTLRTATHAASQRLTETSVTTVDGNMMVTQATLRPGEFTMEFADPIEHRGRYLLTFKVDLLEP